MIYREFQPAAALRGVVDRFWWLEGPASAIDADPIPPDGHAEIIVHAGDPFARIADDGSWVTQQRVLLAGQATRAVRVAPRGFARIAGARLTPTGAYALFRHPQHELADRIVDLRDVHRDLATHLVCDVAGRDESAGMVAALERALCDIVGAPNPPTATDRAIGIAHARCGLVRVDEIARAVGVSARQLERGFRDRVGIGPKLFLRIVRFQEVLRTVRAGGCGTGWADVAAAHGYYDQAHFINDFKAFVGESPAAWNVNETSLAAIFSATRG